MVQGSYTPPFSSQVVSPISGITSSSLLSICPGILSTQNHGAFLLLREGGRRSLKPSCGVDAMFCPLSAMFCLLSPNMWRMRLLLGSTVPVQTPYSSEQLHCLKQLLWSPWVALGPGPFLLAPSASMAMSVLVEEVLILSCTDILQPVSLTVGLPCTSVNCAGCPFRIPSCLKVISFSAVTWLSSHVKLHLVEWIRCSSISHPILQPKRPLSHGKRVVLYFR